MYIIMCTGTMCVCTPPGIMHTAFFNIQKPIKHYHNHYLQKQPDKIFLTLFRLSLLGQGARDHSERQVGLGGEFDLLPGYRGCARLHYLSGVVVQVGVCTVWKRKTLKVWFRTSHS